MPRVEVPLNKLIDVIMKSMDVIMKWLGYVPICELDAANADRKNVEQKLANVESRLLTSISSNSATRTEIQNLEKLSRSNAKAIARLKDQSTPPLCSVLRTPRNFRAQEPSPAHPTTEDANAEAAEGAPSTLRKQESRKRTMSVNQTSPASASAASAPLRLPLRSKDRHTEAPHHDPE
jgi:hypothetical protein